jgi:UDP-N-acetylmuramoyl-tripeptide--D-alanyl-D-alanine ligase
MKPLSIHEIRKVVGGKPVAGIPADVPPITAVSTDSRTISPSSLFVAIKGEKHDGHDYVPQAAAAGAIAALVEHPPKVTRPNPDFHLIQVPDTRKALGKLANHVRRQLHAKVIAVAGSNGKTGTKHLIAAALSSKLAGTCSPKSFNNDIGVPLTIFPADALQDYLVLEMGTNHPGEIRTLATMARPDIAVITNCFAEHLEGLGNLLGVRRENASIVEGLDSTKGLLIVNGDDPELLSAVAHWGGRKITFGFNPANDLFATGVQCDATGVRFFLNGNQKVQFHVPLLGKHTACNALAAIAVGRRLGLTDHELAQGLAGAKGPDMRLQLQHVGGVTLLNDAYNANPASVRAALDTLSNLPGRRRIAVLGDMLELGPSGDRFHREVGELAAPIGLDLLVCVGPQSRLIRDAAIAKGMDAARVSHFVDSASAARHVPHSLGHGDLVLIKGSRGIRLEYVAQAISEGRNATSPADTTA